jgi:hypothetical protein
MALKVLVCSLAVASAFKVDSPAPKPAIGKALALRGGLSLETSSLIGALYNGGFGVTLMVNPDAFYGPNGVMPYFSAELGVVAQKFFGRAFGAMLTGLAAMHFLDGASQTLCKQMAITAILILYPMALCVLDEANFKAIWKPQMAMHLALVYITSKAGGLI